MKIRAVAYSVVAIALLGVFGYRSCLRLNGANRPDLARLSKGEAREAARISDRVNDLGFKMLRYYYSKLGAKNILVSPLSLMSSSSISANIYEDPARKEILRALGCANLDLPNKALPSWVSKDLRSAKSPILVSNALFLRPPLKPIPSLESLLKSAYACDLAVLSTNNAQARGQVADWISKATKGRVKPSQPAFSNDLRFVVANAIWFKCAWQFQFDKTKTLSEDFTRTDGSKVKADLMMFKKGIKAGHGYEPGDFVVLPYADGDFVMVLIKPEDRKKLADLIKLMDSKAFAEMIDAKPDLVVSPTVPRFDISGTANLIPFLKKQGLKKAFIPQPAPRLNSKQPVMLTDAIQSAWIKVDEEGTEAGVATEEFHGCAKAGPLDFAEPFIYAICHKPTKTIVFIGLCADPTSKDAL